MAGTSPAMTESAVSGPTLGVTKTSNLSVKPLKLLNRPPPIKFLKAQSDA